MLENLVIYLLFENQFLFVLMYYSTEKEILGILRILYEIWSKYVKSFEVWQK